jgi:hypothetical protein
VAKISEFERSQLSKETAVQCIRYSKNYTGMKLRFMSTILSFFPFFLIQIVVNESVLTEDVSTSLHGVSLWPKFNQNQC